MFSKGLPTLQIYYVSLFSSVFSIKTILSSPLFVCSLSSLLLVFPKASQASPAEALLSSLPPNAPPVLHLTTPHLPPQDSWHLHSSLEFTKPVPVYYVTLVSPAEAPDAAGSTCASRAITLERPEGAPMCKAFLVKCQAVPSKQKRAEPAQRSWGGSQELRPPRLQLITSLSL